LVCISLSNAAVIVGAGPSGSVCAYFLAKGGARVALLEKEKFPRDKWVLQTWRSVKCCTLDAF
jgi:flavin-dependent dehydrogenase